MKSSLLKVVVVSSISSALCACSGFFDKDNTPTPTPLTRFAYTANPHLNWYASANAGAGNDRLRLVPAVNATTIYTAGNNGYVTATDKMTGRTLWQTSSGYEITAGPSVGTDKVYVGTRHGRLVALDATTGAVAWSKRLDGEILSPPTASRDLVLVKTIDGKLTALSAQLGDSIWHYQQTEPALILRSGSAPQVQGDAVVTGFANGKLINVMRTNGNPVWQQVVAVPEGSFAIQRMVDIDADPVIYGDRVYVATYQGHIAALSLTTGTPIWSHNMSSFTGLSVENGQLFVSDANGTVWGFDAYSGNVRWKQTALAYRDITGPASLTNAVIVGDGEGYLHWLDKGDGHFIARTKVNKNGILATPVVNQNTAYIFTKDGHLASYTLS